MSPTQEKCLHLQRSVWSCGGFFVWYSYRWGSKRHGISERYLTPWQTTQQLPTEMLQSCQRTMSDFFRSHDESSTSLIHLNDHSHCNGTGIRPNSYHTITLYQPRPLDGVFTVWAMHQLWSKLLNLDPHWYFPCTIWPQTLQEAAMGSESASYLLVPPWADNRENRPLFVNSCPAESKEGSWNSPVHHQFPCGSSLHSDPKNPSTIKAFGFFRLETIFPQLLFLYTGSTCDGLLDYNIVNMMVRDTTNLISYTPKHKTDWPFTMAVTTGISRLERPSAAKSSTRVLVTRALAPIITKSPELNMLPLATESLLERLIGLEGLSSQSMAKC